MAGDPEAVYWSALSSLDELSEDDRARVALNWVKYILLKEAGAHAGGSNIEKFKRYEVLCATFALDVTSLPDQWIQRLRAKATTMKGPNETAH